MFFLFHFILKWNVLFVSRNIVRHEWNFKTPSWLLSARLCAQKNRTIKNNLSGNKNDFFNCDQMSSSVSSWITKCRLHAVIAPPERKSYSPSPKQPSMYTYGFLFQSISKPSSNHSCFSFPKPHDFRVKALSFWRKLIHPWEVHLVAVNRVDLFISHNCILRQSHTYWQLFIKSR